MSERWVHRRVILGHQMGWCSFWRCPGPNSLKCVTLKLKPGFSTGAHPSLIAPGMVTSERA